MNKNECSGGRLCKWIMKKIHKLKEIIDWLCIEQNDVSECAD